jgi:glycosyltransferase involved in cell wall biosynthesis
MAAGTPVVATTVGGIPELVDEGEQGYLVEPNDHISLAGQVERLLSHGETERARMSDRARDRAHEYSWDGIARQFASVYDGVRAR